MLESRSHASQKKNSMPTTKQTLDCTVRRFQASFTFEIHPVLSPVPWKPCTRLHLHARRLRGVAADASVVGRLGSRIAREIGECPRNNLCCWARAASDVPYLLASSSPIRRRAASQRSPGERERVRGQGIEGRDVSACRSETLYPVAGRHVGYDSCASRGSIFAGYFEGKNEEGDEESAKRGRERTGSERGSLKVSLSPVFGNEAGRSLREEGKKVTVRF